MARIILDLPRYKGEYPFDLETEPFTNLEWRWIKKISGYMPLTLQDGFQGGDPDLFVAFAVIALARDGRIRKEDALTVADSFADVPFDGTAIKLVAADGELEEDADALPPPPPAGPLPRNIGRSSSTTLDPSADLPRRTGALA